MKYQMQYQTKTFLRTTLLSTALLAGGSVLADEPVARDPAPTRHQLMKECMEKEKAADSGRPSYELSQDCRDISKTQKENADSARKSEATANSQAQPQR